MTLKLYYKTSFITGVSESALQAAQSSLQQEQQQAALRHAQLTEQHSAAVKELSLQHEQQLQQLQLKHEKQLQSISEDQEITRQKGKPRAPEKLILLAMVELGK